MRTVRQTTSPHVIAQSHGGSVAVRQSGAPTQVRPLHVGLVVASLIFLVYYVVQANMIAADAWRLRDAQDRLRGLAGERDALIAEQAKLDDRTVLSALAQDVGMVPAGAVSYLIQPADVAAR